MFPHDTSPDPSAILSILCADSSVSPLALALAGDPVLDQTSLLPPATPHDVPLTTPPADYLVSPQDLAPPMDPITDLISPLPLRRFDWVKAPSAYLRDYSCFSAVFFFHEPHTYRETYTNPLW